MSYILFGTINTQTYRLIVAPYEIPLPEAQTSYVAIPGRDGSLDLSEGFGTVRYNDRTIALKLYAVGEYGSRVSSFINAVHGKRMEITFSKDPDWKYTGRVSITGIDRMDGYCEISIEVNAEPYKRKILETSVGVTGSGTATLVNSRMPVVPAVTNTAQAILSWTEGSTTKTVTLSAGTHTVPDLVLGDSETKTVTVDSSGLTTFTYREGKL